MGRQGNTNPSPGLFEVLIRDPRLRNYSPKTIKAYKSCLHSFIDYFKPRHPRELTENDIRNYLLYLIEDKKFATSTVNQVFNALCQNIFSILPNHRKESLQ